MSVINDLFGVLKPVLHKYTEGLPIHKFLLKAGIRQVTKLTPNLSKTILYTKSNRKDVMDAIVKLLMGNDELSKKFRVPFSEVCKIVNLKTSLLIDEKAKIAVELNKQDTHKEDMINKMTVAEADEKAAEVIDNVVEAIPDDENKGDIENVQS